LSSHFWIFALDFPFPIESLRATEVLLCFLKLLPPLQSGPIGSQGPLRTCRPALPSLRLGQRLKGTFGLFSDTSLLGASCPAIPFSLPTPLLYVKNRILFWKHEMKNTISSFFPPPPPSPVFFSFPRASRPAGSFLFIPYDLDNLMRNFSPMKGACFIKPLALSLV